MKSLKLLPFAVAALIPFQAVAMTTCMPPADDVSVIQDKNAFFDASEQIAFSPPTSEAETNEILAKLKPALTAFELIHEQANLNLQETEIGAAGTLIAAIRAETVTQDARKTLDGTSAEYSAAQADLAALRAQPGSQENKAEIAALAWEISTLSHSVEGARRDLVQAEVALRDARSINTKADNAIAKAQVAVAEAEKANDMILTKIARVEAEKFDAQQGSESAFEIASGGDDSSSDNARGSEKRCSNGDPVSVEGGNS